MAISVRKRFEVFKRDSFTCRYCGQTSPGVVLEVDHVIPLCQGGTDDLINLVTSCWECNRGKAGMSIASAVTGDEPHDRAIVLLERERQLREYNAVVTEIAEHREIAVAQMNVRWWEATGRWLRGPDESWLLSQLDVVPEGVLDDAVDAAIAAGKTRGLAYVTACVQKWRAHNDEFSLRVQDVSKGTH